MTKSREIKARGGNSESLGLDVITTLNAVKEFLNKLHKTVKLVIQKRSADIWSSKHLLFCPFGKLPTLFEC